jgi:ankyrin repeat protein
MRQNEKITNNEDETAFMIASENDHEEVASILLEYEAKRENY